MRMMGPGSPEQPICYEEIVCRLNMVPTSDATWQHIQ